MTHLTCTHSNTYRSRKLPVPVTQRRNNTVSPNTHRSGSCRMACLNSNIQEADTGKSLTSMPSWSVLYEFQTSQDSIVRPWQGNKSMRAYYFCSSLRTQRGAERLGPTPALREGLRNPAQAPDAAKRTCPPRHSEASLIVLSPIASSQHLSGIHRRVGSGIVRHSGLLH